MGYGKTFWGDVDGVGSKLLKLRWGLKAFSNRRDVLTVTLVGCRAKWRNWY